MCVKKPNSQRRRQHTVVTTETSQNKAVDSEQSLAKQDYNQLNNIYGKSFHENGQLAYDGNSIRGIYNGQGKTYDENGQLEYDGNWKNGRYDGVGKAYGINSELVYEGNWKNGKYDGHGKYNYIDGRMAYDGYWKDGMYNGPGKTYYENGNVEYDGNWKDGIYHGLGKYFHENGQLKYDGNSKDGKFDGKGYIWDEHGQLEYDGHLKDSKYDGEGTYFHCQGGSMNYPFICDIFSENEPINAKLRVYHFNGKQITKKIFNKKKMVKGLSISYNPDGSILNVQDGVSPITTFEHIWRSDLQVMLTFMPDNPRERGLQDITNLLFNQNRS